MMTTSTSTRSNIKGIVLSDIHFGHSNTPTEHIIRNIEKLVNKPELLKEIDIIWFSGDVFDHGLDFNDPNIYRILAWFKALAALAKEYDVIIEFLYGTPSHDKRQSAFFEFVNNLFDIGANVTYVSELSIIYNEKLKIHVLYIPDRARSNSSITWRDVCRLLEDRKLKQVDFAITHGFFDFQLPELALSSTDHHLSEAYSKIVKYAIFNGHDHTPKHSLNIWVPGSLDRLRHGEEEDKGMLFFETMGDGIDVKFIKNYGAMKFITLRFDNNETVEDVIEYIDAKVNNDPMAFVRIVAPRESLTFHIGEQLEKVYPRYRITFEEPDREKEKSIGAIATIAENANALSAISLTKNNLRDELLSMVDEVKPEITPLAKFLLNEVLHDE